MTASIDKLLAARAKTKAEMGGAAKVAKVHGVGGYTARDWIDALIEPGSFHEIGTFAQPQQLELRDGAFGDGKISGHAKVAGRPVTINADDSTVKGGSEGRTNMWKTHRLYQQALDFGNPYVLFGNSGGGRVDDMLGAGQMSRQTSLEAFAGRSRRIPMAVAIVGRSYGESSFMAALSDFVVQLRGSAMAVTSPRVIEVATSEIIDEEALGGADTHSNKTGQIDLAVDSKEEVIAALQEFLSYMPNNAMAMPPRSATRRREPEPSLRVIVPESRRRGYDVRKVIAGIADGGRYLELRPRFARSLVIALARLNGHSVGFIANQPIYQAGSMGPAACDKAIRFTCLCDSFNIPLIFLADTPGFLVGSQVEHDRMLFKGMMLNQAIVHARVPRITVLLRKAFGLAYFAMSGGEQGARFSYAWPTGEISFMDPDVAANVVHGGRLASLSGGARQSEHARLAATFAKDTGALDAAAVMGVDEVIDPADTPVVLGEAIERLLTVYDPRRTDRILSAWPTSF